MGEFEAIVSEKAKEAQARILPFLLAEEGVQKTVFSAMRYAVGSGGKRIRPILMREAFLLFTEETKGSVRADMLHAFMAALEMIHTSSLIHDDLPEMDNDDLRRGRPTCHKVYGEAMALLAGDGLLNLAFETTAQAMQRAAESMAADGNIWDMRTQVSDADPMMLRKVAQANKILAEKAGTKGMLGGQVADVEGEKKPELTMENILFIHEKKTAALLQAALMIGGCLGGASPDEVERLERAGYDIGLAFQIRDDILDVIGDQETFGKPIGSDAKNEKNTYVSLIGVEKAEEEVIRLSDEAKAELAALPGNHDFLENLIDWMTVRVK
ncbi:MAG: polyprenyl synthetase family protein [Lachnospiraceae bacterium]|nr:polyprenyl synthetase family protein [Lachnospiraceae bacterium]